MEYTAAVFVARFVQEGFSLRLACTMYSNEDCALSASVRV